MTIERD